jgi:hypothetical protein
MAQPASYSRPRWFVPTVSSKGVISRCVTGDNEAAVKGVKRFVEHSSHHLGLIEWSPLDGEAFPAEPANERTESRNISGPPAFCTIHRMGLTAEQKRELFVSVTGDNEAAVKGVKRFVEHSSHHLGLIEWSKRTHGIEEHLRATRLLYNPSHGLDSRAKAHFHGLARMCLLL